MTSGRKHQPATGAGPSGQVCKKIKVHNARTPDRLLPSTSDSSPSPYRPLPPTADSSPSTGSSPIQPSHALQTPPPPQAPPPSSPSEVKQGHGGLPQQLWSFPLLVGVWRPSSVLVQNPKEGQSQDRLQRKNRHGNGEADPGTAPKTGKGVITAPVQVGGGPADSQLVPLDVVEEVLVGADPLGLDRLKQVLAIVSEGAHQVVLLITVEEQSRVSTCSEPP